MTMTNTFTIDLDRSELLIDLQSGIDVVESTHPIMIDSVEGPMVVVSDDRFISLELMLFAGLAPEDDIVQLDAASDIAVHIASCDVLPSLFMVAASVLDEARAVLKRIGLDNIAVIAV